MQNKDLSNAFHVGGSLETALNGKYNLDTASIIQEAVKLTQKHFWQFLPAILFFMAANLALFFLILALHSGEPLSLLSTFIHAKEQNPKADEAIKIALFFSTVFSAPLYAGASLMGLSHAIGFKSKYFDITKGLKYAASAIIIVCLINMAKNITNYFIPLLGLLLGVLLSMTVLLVCEKRLSIFQAMQLSFQATIKKIFAMLSIYAVLAGMFLFSYATAGMALLWVLPFMFNVKGVLYREMFGVGIEVTITEEKNSDTIFHA